MSSGMGPTRVSVPNFGRAALYGVVRNGKHIQRETTSHDHTGLSRIWFPHHFLCFCPYRFLHVECLSLSFISHTGLFYPYMPISDATFSKKPFFIPCATWYNFPLLWWIPCSSLFVTFCGTHHILLCIVLIWVHVQIPSSSFLIFV